MTLGLLAIMLDEAALVERWAQTVDRVARVGVPFDQILVVDGGSKDGTPDRLHALGIPVVERQFQDHFADQRNFGLDQITTDWVFELDADEIPSTPLLAGLRFIVANAELASVGCVGVARLNFLDDILVPGPGCGGLDYQYRIHRRTCHWRGVVHEEVVGYRARYELPIDDGHFIAHRKQNGRHEARNAYYRTLKP